ncbi:ATP-binding cassette domain-containing protein [Hoyosella sp. G463]|uniref:ATP-binding cassette domain-containing protein n=1 Tax=Lolliginicoccus lacisalsi TaxID=2742202 RepID=A0A927JC05_9ACTN|nr:ATP-binding cassette domain-containing protein [Lolliginicoccus lacisalsi]MBD8506380.1 ATP-binding cassette domain-containing protein [Lolliginicoccus lacisalsi]
MRSSPETAVVVDDVVKTFGDVTALSGISFSVPKGTVLGVLGPNGAGKTTMVSVLSTLQQPDFGKAWVAGFDVVEQAADVRRSIMLTGQYAALDATLTGRENLQLFGRLMGLNRRDSKTRAQQLLEAFDLVYAGNRRVGGYSGGMRRRIDIACGLVTRPEVVFLDEPTTGLDPRSRQAVWSLVKSLKNEGITVLLTTQYLEEADILSDNIIVIDKGTVIAEGTADQLKQRTGGSYCEVVPLNPTHLQKIQALLADLYPQDAPLPEIKPDADRLSLPAIDGPATLSEVLRRLDMENIQLADVALRRPSLDDVFLSLTGHGSKEDARP